MTNSNNIPTGPGWWYRDDSQSRAIVYVYYGESGDSLYYYPEGLSHPGAELIDDGLWLGPVPMPGEWVSRHQWETLVDAVDGIQDWGGTYIGECMYGPEWGPR